MLPQGGSIRTIMHDNLNQMGNRNVWLQLLKKLVNSQEDRLGSKLSPVDKVPIRAAWIGGACAVLAAVIAVVLPIYLAHGTSSTSHANGQSPPPGISASSQKSSDAPTPTFGPTWTETAYSQAKTFADFVNAGYPLGASLSPGQAVQVSCRVRGFKVKDGDTWWYRLASSPWNGHYYATSDVFYNTPDTSGNPINGIVVDTQVKLC